MMGIAKENDPTHDGACSPNASPYGVSRPYRNRFHRLGYREKAQDNEDRGDDAGNRFRESLAEFKGDGKAYLKKTGKQKKKPGDRHRCMVL